jgi:membrane fusion protein, copper/silver efflux system
MKNHEYSDHNLDTEEDMRTLGFAAIGALLLVAAGLAAYVAYAQAGLKWQTAAVNVPIGEDVRIDVNLIDGNDNPVSKTITVTSSRIDMGPDGMPTMTAPLRAAGSVQPGTVSFLTKLPSAGRWSLTLTANVAGGAQAITGSVIIVAGKKHSDVTHYKSGEPRKILYYRAPMGTDTSAIPKKDEMGMDYAPVYADEVSGQPGIMRINPEKIQRAGVQTDIVKRIALISRVQAVGTVTPDESRLAILTTKFSGFVETLFVSTTGSEVKAGQPLMSVWIEDKDILTKEVDYVFAAHSGVGINATQAADNLRLFGIPDAAIAEMKRTGRLTRSLVINASISGTVLEKPAISGMHFVAGDMLFKTADLTNVWVLAQASERDLVGIHEGQTAKIAFRDDPNKSFEGRVSFVYPQIEAATRTAQVRIIVANPDGRIRIGQYADVTIEAPISNGPVIAIPDSAVIDSGTRQVAFVAKPGGIFEPRNLVLGVRSGGYDEVRSGLSEGERVVVSGNFLIDAESNLQTALGTFQSPANPQ